MVIKLSRFLKTVLVVVTAFVLVLSTQLSSFAIEHYRYNQNNEIVGLTSWAWNPSGEITIPAKATGIKSGAICNSFLGITVNVSRITKVIIPESVMFIESGAFTSNCSSLKEVVIQNAKSKVIVANDAFPSGVAVTYTVEEATQPPTTTKPTPPPTTTQPPETTQPPATTAPSTTQATTVSDNQNAERKPATTKAPLANKAPLDTTKPVQVEVTNNDVPLAEINNEGGYPDELEVWNSLVNANGNTQEATTTQEKQSKNKSTVADYAVNASVVVVTFTTIIFTFFKFKR